MSKTQNKKPPRWAARVLLRLCRPTDRDSLKDDLEIEFGDLASERGRLFASVWYVLHVLRALPELLYILFSWRLTMFKNYLKIAFRNIARKKIYSFISIVGMAVGMACCFVILIFLFDELSYDSFHNDSESIYRVVRQMPDIHGPSTRNPLAPALMENFPEIKLAVRTWMLRESNTFRVDEVGFQQDGILFADPDFFKLFTYQFLRGDSEHPLDNPFSVVLTQSAAQKYFGNQNPLGKTISFDGEFDLMVTAVIENVPHNSHLQFEVVLPIEGFNTIAGYLYGYDASSHRISDNWIAGMFNTYLKLHRNINPKDLEQKFPGFLTKYAPYNKELLDETLYLQPVESIHLHSQYRSVVDKISDIKFIYAVFAIGLVILLMSCFNVINLTTAQFSARMKEIGIRKVVGAQRKQLAGQFLIETSVFSLIAFLLSLVFIMIFKPIISDILGYHFLFTYFGEYSILLFVFFIGLLTIPIIGTYPAIFFSAFKPKNIVKDMIIPKKEGKGVRSLFVLAQFSITIVLLACTGLIYKQVQYMKSKDLGYSKEQIVVVSVKDDEVREQYETIKNELNRQPQISQVSFSSVLPSKIQQSTTMDLEIEGNRKVFEMNFAAIDYDFFDLYNIDIIKGRKYSKDFPSDAENSIIINEKAAEILNWENPIGKSLRIFGSNRTVIGVMENFNFQTLHTEIAPLALRLSGISYHFASIKISTSDIQSIIGNIEQTFKQFSPQRPFEYYFFDDYFENLYRTEEDFGRTMGYFTLLAILISSLGLWGLAYFIGERRTKEIGIRKVLGASVPGLIAMLSVEFTKWALLANILAIPVANFVMNKWLQDFAYKINMGWDVFILSGILALVIALLTVSTQAIRAALANPMDSLRYE